MTKGQVDKSQPYHLQLLVNDFLDSEFEDDISPEDIKFLVEKKYKPDLLHRLDDPEIGQAASSALKRGYQIMIDQDSADYRYANALEDTIDLLQKIIPDKPEQDRDFWTNAKIDLHEFDFFRAALLYVSTVPLNKLKPARIHANSDEMEKFDAAKKVIAGGEATLEKIDFLFTGIANRRGESNLGKEIGIVQSFVTPILIGYRELDMAKNFSAQKSGIAG